MRTWCKYTARSMLSAWRTGTPPSSPSRAASSSSLDRSSESSLSRPCTEQAAEQRPPMLQPSNTGKAGAPADLNVLRLGLQLRPCHGCSSEVPSQPQQWCAEWEQPTGGCLGLCQAR